MAYVLPRVVKEHFGDDRYMSEEGDITIDEENYTPPITSSGRPKCGNLQPERQRIVVV
jgi:hypothetical protein